MSRLSMVLVGDTYAQRADPDSAFAANVNIFAGAAIAFCNLETVVCNSIHLDPHDKAHQPRTDEWILPAYLRAGINVMNIANNSTTYHGRECFLRSLDVLEEAGVIYGGGGRDVAAARKPAIIEKEGTKVGFVCRTSVGRPDMAATASEGGTAFFRVTTAYEPRSRLVESPGTPPIVHTFPNPDDCKDLAVDIETAREQADIVVVSWHWGVSPIAGGGTEIVDYQRDMAHFAIDAGADLVVGHHPHLLQPIEVYKGKVIAYSLGNYVHDMDTFIPGRKLDAMALQCSLEHRKIQKVSLLLGQIDGHGPPEFLSSIEEEGPLEHLRQLSSPFGTSFIPEINSVTIITTS